MDLQNSFYDNELYDRCEDLSDLNKSTLHKELYEHCEEFKFKNKSPILPVTRGVKRKRVSEAALQPRDSSAPAFVVEPLQVIESQQPSTSRTTAEAPPTHIVGDTVECKTCQRIVSSHSRSNIHKKITV